MTTYTKEYLQSKLVTELKKMAKSMGITNYSKLKKSEVIDVILKHRGDKKSLTRSPKAKAVSKKNVVKKLTKKQKEREALLEKEGIYRADYPPGTRFVIPKKGRKIQVIFPRSPKSPPIKKSPQKFNFRGSPIY